MRDYIEYMRKEKRKADNTLVAYERDLKAFDSFLNSRGVNGLEGCSDSDAVAYVLQLNRENSDMASTAALTGLQEQLNSLHFVISGSEICAKSSRTLTAPAQ